MARSTNRLPEIIAELPVAVRAALVASAQQIAQDAQDRVAYDPNKSPHVRDEIHVEIADEGIYVIAGEQDGAFWGNMLEHGTTHSAPQPFLVPALEENTERTIAAVEAAAKKAVS